MRPYCDIYPIEIYKINYHNFMCILFPKIVTLQRSAMGWRVNEEF